jgi:hypothetical protein
MPEKLFARTFTAVALVAADEGDFVGYTEP